MRALEILHEHLEEKFGFVHAARRRALQRVVEALIVGKKLWLTALGRALPGDVLRKHAIKAVDRLLGNEHFYDERFAIARALVEVMLRPGAQPVVLVDTCELRHETIVLTASIAHAGRSIPFWSMPVTGFRPNDRLSRRFLSELVQILPKGCRPILITDAGFERGWFDEVEKLGWDYIGRIRGNTMFWLGSDLLTCKQLHRRATRRAKNLGRLRFPKSDPRTRRVVLSKLPSSGHRRIKTRRGPGSDTNYRIYRTNAHEPLLLTTSLACNAQQVVALYGIRMQIEQAFRDLKNHRWGWSLRHCRTRSKKRIVLLLLLASIAMLFQQLTGVAGEALGLSRAHQANTVRDHRVLSVFTLGGLILNGPDCDRISRAAFARALSLLRRKTRGYAFAGT